MLSNLDKAGRIQALLRDKGWISKRRGAGDLAAIRSVIFEALEECDRGQYEFFFAIDESERQTAMLALAELSLSRPGWKEMLDGIATKMHGREMYDQFRTTSAYRIKPAL